ncbi:MAG: ATP-binding protein, partial [Verrucomicrobiota bacterium]
PAIERELREAASRRQCHCAEASLRLKSAALDAAANAIVITDGTGKIEWVNQAFSTMTGYSAAEVTGQNPRLLKSGQHDQTFYQEMWNTILAGKPWHGELVNRRKDGTLYDDEMTVTPVIQARGEISHFVAVKQSITARKQLEAQFLQSQKMEAFGQLAGGVAHDFNNILAAVMLEIELLLTENLPDGVQHGLKQITANAERAVTLTRQLLQFSRKQRMERKQLDLNAVVTDVVQMLQRMVGENIQILTALLPGPAHVQADASLLGQVLTNLVINARDAIPERGQIEIRLAAPNVAAAFAARQQDKRGLYFRLSVQDNGTGIAPEVLPRIFEPFFTTKDVGKGSGLGLSAVQGIMAQHHGWVEVETTVGQGTTFHLYLPAAAAEPPAALASARPSRSLRGTETILVVEDNVPLLTAMTTALQYFGYRIIPATSATQALELWPQHRAAIALLLTDVIMPNGVSGPQLGARLNKDKPDLKVILMSGYPRECLDEELDLREGQNFLHKPFKPTDLARLLRNLLDTTPK